jgi:hypothetical protein
MLLLLLLLLLLLQQHPSTAPSRNHLIHIHPASSPSPAACHHPPTQPASPTY